MPQSVSDTAYVRQAADENLPERLGASRRFWLGKRKPQSPVASAIPLKMSLFYLRLIRICRSP